MKLAFTKMHHLGNDFIVVDFRPYEKENRKFTKSFEEIFGPGTVRGLCDRHFGIGADGVVGVLSPSSEEFDCKMRIINGDGSEARMCGNGLACFALFVAEKTPAKKKFKVETLSGPRGAAVGKDREGREKILLDMGKAEQIFTATLKAGGRSISADAISMGNPHCVIFTKEPIAPAEFRRLGPLIENHHLFADRTNAEFVTVRSASEIDVAVWERGAGETLACGTGASAAAFAAYIKGLCTNKIKVNLPGGRCFVEIKNGGRIFLHCSPVRVFEGTIELPA